MTDAKHQLPDGRPETSRDPMPIDDLVAAFLDNRRTTHSSGPFWAYKCAARHFLLWLCQHRISLGSVDDTVVMRFARHRCRCSGYSPNAFARPMYIGRVRRFVHFLEERGDIPINDDLHNIASHFAVYSAFLRDMGYSVVTQQLYRSEAEHFGQWLRQSRIQWRDVNDVIIERFAQHDCCCTIRRKRGTIAAPSGTNRRRRGARRFVGFLRELGLIPAADVAIPRAENSNLVAYRTWLKQCRGATDETIRRYTYEVRRWCSMLGADPSTYDAATIRDVVLNQGPERSCSSVRLTGTVLQSFLGFLTMQGECRPELVHAVPRVPKRYLSTLPRYVSPDVIERIINSCDIITPVGIRDRAIILLLARLGLRAGDVWRLRLADIDWVNATICVHGKGRKSVRLPLPQDAGDAVLAYLEKARPCGSEERVFLRVQAPFTAFKSASEISGIVARVLTRGNIKGIPTGAHIFRHSLATTMLRSGGSLESVGAVLRHSSSGTTSIYAKVNVSMLERVAQPWPGDTPC